MNPIDSTTSKRLDWLDYQLHVIGSLGTETQTALADQLARIRAERRAILNKQPANTAQKFNMTKRQSCDILNQR